jgi:hypothetical protein
MTCTHGRLSNEKLALGQRVVWLHDGHVAHENRHPVHLAARKPQPIRTMNLYLISQTVNRNYDTFDSAVVAAPSEEIARNTIPAFDRGGKATAMHIMHIDDFWCAPENVKVELIGAAVKGTRRGTICSSFNAG